MLSWSWAEDMLVRSRSYWLSTTRPDHSPHAMPVWGVWMDGRFLFDTHPLSQKARNLEHDRRAVVHLESAEEVVVLEGEVEVDEDVPAPRFERFRLAFEEKYGRFPCGAFEFTPRTAYAWDNADYAGSVTRYDLSRD